MKRIVALFALLALLGSTALAQLKIDLKTPLDDKEKLKLAKAGLGAYLRQAEWVEVVNVGEDYSLWIKNLKRRFKGNTLHFEADLELKTRADLGSGDLVNARHIKDSIDLHEAANLQTFEEREMSELVEKQLTKNDKFKPVPALIGTATSVPLAGTVVQQGLKYLGVDLESKFSPDQAIEAMTLGAVLFVHAKEMIDALPAKPQEKK
ncbi:MAG: hypothetical protein HYY49_10420 [Ignavibacteriales bacterium]|nr:hypothetical protein [Ignavibacteriales bacterium]